MLVSRANLVGGGMQYLNCWLATPQRDIADRWCPTLARALDRIRNRLQAWIGQIRQVRLQEIAHVAEPLAQVCAIRARFELRQRVKRLVDLVEVMVDSVKMR